MSDYANYGPIIRALGEVGSNQGLVSHHAGPATALVIDATSPGCKSPLPVFCIIVSSVQPVQPPPTLSVR